MFTLFISVTNILLPANCVISGKQGQQIFFFNIFNYLAFSDFVFSPEENSLLKASLLNSNNNHICKNKIKLSYDSMLTKKNAYFPSFLMILLLILNLTSTSCPMSVQVGCSSAPQAFIPGTRLKDQPLGVGWGGLVLSRDLKFSLVFYWSKQIMQSASVSMGQVHVFMRSVASHRAMNGDWSR